MTVKEDLAPLEVRIMALLKLSDDWSVDMLSSATGEGDRAAVQAELNRLFNSGRVDTNRRGYGHRVLWRKR